MGQSLNLHIFEYEGKKGKYYVAYIDQKAYFVYGVTKDKVIKRVNLKTKKPYLLYKGEYKIINDLIFI